ncbi:hypothetical protein PM082_007805 [Marasmius tenuissimus]|nr:hypothetical protein PM082_007805 [Marasmius tenuissimus]
MRRHCNRMRSLDQSLDLTQMGDGQMWERNSIPLKAAPAAGQNIRSKNVVPAKEPDIGLMNGRALA